jgi:hypothetical protein
MKFGDVSRRHNDQGLGIRSSVGSRWGVAGVQAMLLVGGMQWKFTGAELL